MDEMTAPRTGTSRLKALRGDKEGETRDLSPAQRVSRRERLSRPEATRVKPGEIAETFANVELPQQATDVVMIVRCKPGGLLPTGYPSGVGGETLYGPAWLLDGLIPSEPVALYASQKDARELYDMLAGPEGELWQKKRRRAEAIAAAQALEAENAAIEKENSKTVRRAGGDGSPPRSSSSETTSGRPRVSRRERLREASRTTPSH